VNTLFVDFIPDNMALAAAEQGTTSSKKKTKRRSTNKEILAECLKM